MKHLRISIICLLVLLLLTSALPAYADTEEAENLTAKCSFDFGRYKSAKGRVLSDSTRYQIFDGNDSFSLTWEEPFEGARLCLDWEYAPEGASVLQYDANGELLLQEAIPSFHSTATALLPDARKAVVQAGETGMQVRVCAVYGAGELPKAFRAWQETPDHLDYLLISTHPDDDVLFLGSVVPVYGAEQGYVGSIVYVTRSRDEAVGRVRVGEAESGAWTMGLRYYPVFLNMPDVADSSSKEKKKLFQYDDLLVNLVRTYRRLHPLVVVAQDTEGEYGHWQHILTSQASREAFTLAADPTFDPESAEQYGTWQVQKLFLHLFPENPILIDAHAPLSFFDGKNAFEVACEAYTKHESQQRMWFHVEQDDEKYAFNRFGMAEGVVPAGESLFENVDESLFYGYVPPTPEPTEVPTPEPTEEPTPAPIVEITPEPTEEPTPAPAEAPTEAPQTPAPEPERKTAGPDRVILIVLGFAAVAAIAALVLLLLKKKRDAR